MIKIDDNLCAGCGYCVDECPGGFKIEAGIAVIINPDADGIENAISACPQGAIFDDNADNRSQFNQQGDYTTSRSPISSNTGSGQYKDLDRRTGRGSGRGIGKGLNRNKSGRGKGRRGKGK